MEIRVRAWDKINKRMIYHFLLTSKGEFVALRDPMTPQGDDYGTIDFILPNMDDVVLMLFTTLRDKHGKEIWEGDRVKWHDPLIDCDDIIENITFANGAFCHGGLPLHQISMMSLEVIGSVYGEGEC